MDPDLLTDTSNSDKVESDKWKITDIWWGCI